MYLCLLILSIVRQIKPIAKATQTGKLQMVFKKRPRLGDGEAKVLNVAKITSMTDVTVSGYSKMLIYPENA